MKKSIVLLSIILNSCINSISDNNCIIKESQSFRECNKKYKYYVSCNIGAFYLHSDSLYKIQDTIKIIK